MKQHVMKMTCDEKTCDEKTCDEHVWNQILVQDIMIHSSYYKIFKLLGKLEKNFQSDSINEYITNKNIINSLKTRSVFSKTLQRLESKSFRVIFFGEIFK